MTDDDDIPGKVVWPIVDGQTVQLEDAYATLFDLSDCEIQISSYHQNGSDLTGNLEIHLSGCETYPDAPATYFAKPLKEALEEELEKLVYRDSDDEEIASWKDDEKGKRIKKRTLEMRPQVRRSRRLAELLLDAYAAWEKESE